MLKWLEEVRLCDPNHPDGAEALMGGFMKTFGCERHEAETVLSILQTAWAEWEVGRMVAIVEGAEWFATMEGESYCPVCVANKDIGHYKHCPYSDEYKGG